MCQIENAPSQKLPSYRSPTHSGEQLHAETPFMTARDFCGEWTSSTGDDVEVQFRGAHHAQLRATLVKKDGCKTSFQVRSWNCEWWCGSAFLLEASPSKDQLHWKFGHGGVSTWYRRTATPFLPQAMASTLAHACSSFEGCQSPSEDQQTSLQLPLLPLPVEKVDESLEHSLAGFLSPTEEYFNPGLDYSQRPWNANFFDARAIQSLDYSQFFPPPAESLTGNVWKLSREEEGCRRVQQALHEGDTYSRAQIATELRGHVWKAAEHRHANFVLQKCIQVLPPEASSFIIDELKTDAAWLAKSKTGVRVFQRLLEHCREQVHGMVSELLADARDLCVHQFGNYMMQHILEHGSVDQRHDLAASLLGFLDKRMCSNECGVGVISKALEYAGDEDRQAIAQALLKDKDRFIRVAMQRHGKDAIKELLKGPEEGDRKSVV